MNDYAKEWGEKAEKMLVGRTIVSARYMTKSEADGFGWHTRPLVLLLDDGMSIFASSDDEGNDAGALFTTDPVLDTFPTLL